jgi:hypothetical protein
MPCGTMQGLGVLRCRAVCLLVQDYPSSRVVDPPVTVEGSTHCFAGSRQDA